MRVRRLLWDIVLSDRLLSIATSRRHRRMWGGAVLALAFVVLLMMLSGAHSAGRVGATAPKAIVRKAPPVSILPAEPADGAAAARSKDVDLATPFESLPVLPRKR